MKYMGSKRAMLQNGLGKLLEAEINGRSRFVDLFCGSASVSWFVAQKFDVAVTAVDLQLYSAVLASAVVSRTTRLDIDTLWSTWRSRAQTYIDATDLIHFNGVTRKTVWECRAWAELFPSESLVASYGGHYFSPEQIVWIEALRATLPEQKDHAGVALAALLEAASRAVAAPGHTAQPFQATPTAKKFLAESWAKSIPAFVESSLKAFAGKYAKSIGAAVVADANEFSKTLHPRDLVFVDPPYSAVHYSRFYHVIEGIAHGETSGASGVGRYPPRSDRPRSEYSMKTTAAMAVEQLLFSLAARQTDVVFTFPDHECSNGLSGERICEIAKKHFRIERTMVASTFSTLGGAADSSSMTRKSRQSANELILMLRSR